MMETPKDKIVNEEIYARSVRQYFKGQKPTPKNNLLLTDEEICSHNGCAIGAKVISSPCPHQDKRMCPIFQSTKLCLPFRLVLDQQHEQERVARIKYWIEHTFTDSITKAEMTATNAWQEFWEHEGIK